MRQRGKKEVALFQPDIHEENIVLLIDRWNLMSLKEVQFLLQPLHGIMPFHGHGKRRFVHFKLRCARFIRFGDWFHFRSRLSYVKFELQIITFFIYKCRFLLLL